MWPAQGRPSIGAMVAAERASSEEHVEKLTADLRKMQSVLSTPQLLECQRTLVTFPKESLQMILL